MIYTTSYDDEDYLVNKNTKNIMFFINEIKRTYIAGVCLMHNITLVYF